MKLALVGCGNWGSNLYRAARNIGHPVVCVYDVVPGMAYNLAGHDPVKIVERLEDVEADAVMIATPAGTHYELAQHFINRGMPVFLEKPMGTSFNDCIFLANLSAERGIPLFVDHEYLYQPAVRWVRERIGGELGELLYFHSVRWNNGVVRADADALLNFMPHDVSVSLFLSGQKPLKVHVAGTTYVSRAGAMTRKGLFWDAVSLLLDYPTSHACLFASWCHAQKVRQMTVGCSKGSVVVDDVAKRMTHYQFAGDCEEVVDGRGRIEVVGESVVGVDWTPPLDLSLKAFVDWVGGGPEPVTSARNCLPTYGVVFDARYCA